MHIIRSCFFTVVVALALAACEQPADQTGDEGNSNVELVNYGDEEIVIPADGGDFFFSFMSSTDWTVASSEDWLFVSLDSGKAGSFDVDFSVEANESGDARSADITVSVDDEHSFVVLVTQMQNNVLVVDKQIPSISAEGGLLTFKVTSNVGYEVVSMADWITVISTKAVVDNTVTIKVDANTDEARQSAVRVKSEEEEVLVKVVQEAGITDYLYAIEASYYGDYYGNGTANWILAAFNNDAVKEGKAPKVYVFDLCLPSEYDYFKLDSDGFPEGVLSFNDSHEGFTFNSESVIIDHVTYEDIKLTGGEIVVKDGLFAFTLTDVNGNVHRVKWEITPGYILVYDSSYSSTVTSDYEVSFDKCKISPKGQAAPIDGVDTYQTFIYFSGGHPQIGAKKVADDTAGKLLLSSATEDFTGSYTVEPVGEQTFAAGTVDAANSKFYSYYGNYYVPDGTFQLGGGTLTVTKDGEEYVIEGSFTDDYPYGEPHKLKIYARGVVEVEDVSSSASSASMLSSNSMFDCRLTKVPHKNGNFKFTF